MHGEIINKNKFENNKYIYAFFLALIIFISAFLLSNYFSNLRVANVKTLQENISLDILSNSAQFDLLSQVSCSHLDENILSQELTEIGNKLTFTENQRGIDDKQIKYLSNYYALLQIKDFSLMKKLSEKCIDRKTTFIIYFYSNLTPCKDCENVSSILTSLRKKYKDLRVYSFSIDSNLSAVRTLMNIYKIKNLNVPILIIEDKAYDNLKTFEEIEKLLPEKLKSASSTNATSSNTIINKNKEKNNK